MTDDGPPPPAPAAVPHPTESVAAHGPTESAGTAGSATRPVAVFDIDGVVAVVRPRRHRRRRHPPAWDPIFRAAAAVPPLPEGIALARTLASDHDLVWLTGRPERSRALTLRWFAAQGLAADDLRMRPDADRSPARVFKTQELVRMSRVRPVDIVVDDDPEVVSRLRHRGFPVTLADWLPYEPAMGRAQNHEGRT
ncbi:MAG: hypothetical protein ACQSGP_06650 [Frankia sp.]